MGSDGDVDGPRKRRRLSPPETGPYVLRELVDKVPVSSEGDEGGHITSVEYWNDNLYVGTSLGEVLHFVSIPSDAPDTETAEPAFIPAYRLPVAAATNTLNSSTAVGVQQILVVPRANKACILCNGILTFYTLPELSPAYGNTKVTNCSWVGGLDLNESMDEEQAGDPVVMVARQNHVMLVRLGDEPRRVRSIEFPGCLAGTRRDTIACVADSHSYSLLEVERRQKIHLSTIRSSEEPGDYRVEDIPHRDGTPVQGQMSHSNGNTEAENRLHARSSSLNALIGGMGDRRHSPQSSFPERSLSRTPELRAGTPNAQYANSPNNHANYPSEPARNGSPMPSSSQKPLPPPPALEGSKFKPHVVSPTPSEFLFITGTEASGVGVGMFVNLDGEGTRGTIEFERYPESIVLDNYEDVGANMDAEEGYVLAVVEAEDDEEPKKYIEAQRWDVDPGEGERHKTSIEVPLDTFVSTPVGIHKTTSANQMSFSGVGDIMQMVQLKSLSLGSSSPRTPAENADPRTKASIEQLQKEKELFESQETDSTTSEQLSTQTFRRALEAERNQEEAKIARKLGYVNSSIVLWGGDRIWRLVRNPLALQLENALRLAQPETSNDYQQTDLKAIIELLDEIDTLVPRTENEFLGLKYVKQKASIVLFAKLISTEEAAQTLDMITLTENTLVNGDLDPRILLLFVPLVREEVLQGPQGIWVNRGLAMVAEPLINPSEGSNAVVNISTSVLDMLVRFLMSWQKKRGYGSILDETYVFNSVDAALLHLLLELEAGKYHKANSTGLSSVRTELNKLVDNWKGDFDRAIELLESYQRLFVLSRLYQSRKMSKHVLLTWKRIVEGDTDAGGELTVSAAEIQVRKYLVKIRDVQIVEEYGSWLAARNPSLGIQFFADDTSRVKLDPVQVVSLLKEKAPGAVQVYLEHLVFAKNYSQYADDLIGYYLDTVLSVLENSPEARASLTESYATYRALRPPKPSYLGFISENAPPDHWWQSRLRLLQLLGGESRSQFTSMPGPRDLSYSISTVLTRIEPFQNELVSESIILGGRQGRHHEALHLLTHGLGDYDTAIRYCLFGGVSRPPSSTAVSTASSTQKDLFTHLLKEFLQIEDISDRIERTSDLLTRFASLYNVGDVLALVPEDWSVDILSGFLVRVLRDIVTEKREVKVQRALSAGLNLRIGVEMLEKAEEQVGGGWVEDEDGVRALKEGEKDESGDVKGKGKAKMVIDGSENEQVIG